jgi:mono/diheme cytochrome c family protein
MRPLDFRARVARSFLAGLCVLAGAAALAACEEEPVFTKSKVLGGRKISAETLEEGRESYTHYCRACHGDEGNGKGPSALGLRPPPRDFTQGKFKFAAVESGALPNDDDFRRIVKRGLHGTAMLPWEVPEDELSNIIQYIKTFSPKWEKEKPGKPIVATPDPWVGQEPAAIQRGKELYHVTTQCSGCHPNYATKEDIAAMTLKIKKMPVTDFRPDMYGSVMKESEYRVALKPEDEPPVSEASLKHEGKKGKKHEAKEEGEGEKAKKEKKEPKYHLVSILPPDFTRQPLRSGDALEDLWRTIASGVGGTAMPSWKATAPYTDPTTGEHWDGDKDIWALSHYVKSLVELRGMPGADQLADKFKNQPAWTPPPAPAPTAAAPAPDASAAPATSAAPPTNPPAKGGKAKGGKGEKPAN